MQATIANILSDSRSEILASPQISTLDHTEANIFMGDQISIRVIDNNGQSSTQMVESGIKLTVTPHVAGDNRILLELHPENNSYSYDDKGQVVISKQEAKTKVVVSDGETVVIGGLTKNDEINAETGIPFLKDIPILGYLFKHTRKEINKKDFVIFVTPRIMRNYLADKAPAAKKAEYYEDDYDEDEDW
jgi:type II secretory pathway component GspD/PulD (secretin)